MRFILTITLILTSLIAIHAAEEFTPPAADQILKTLTPVHPRLMIDETTIPRIKKLIMEDEIAAKIYRSVKRRADREIEQPPQKYNIPDGKRLLSVSRRVKERVRRWSLLFLMEGDQKYVNRVWAELNNAAQFKDWNPSHFLDTAEMTYAFATGYDWLYDQWTEKQRKIMRDAIINLGLKPGMKVYKRKRGWHTGHNNWNQVCNGGLGMGALAIADEEPELATKILYNGIKSLPLAMSYYAPDGGGAEGVTYWSYGSRYNVIFLSGLQTALDTDFGLSDIPGFKESGDYQIYISGTTRMSFNFADCGLRRISAPMHFWMGKAYDTPHYSWFRYDTLKKYGRGSELDLLWFDGSAKDYDPSKLALDKRFAKVDVASMRTSWTDSNAIALGIQAGSNMNLRMHRHVDQGTFILEALGVRWAIDSGSERETYQRHRNKRRRWDFYRIRAEGHNTLVFNPREEPTQDLKAACPITKFESTPQKATAVVDMSKVYAEYASKVERTFQTDRKSVTITDDIKAKAPSDLYWFMHTDAEIQIDQKGTLATLTRKGKQLTAKLMSPKNAAFSVMAAKPLPTSPNPKQADNKKRRKLTIHLNDAKNLKIKVKFTPVQPE